MHTASQLTHWQGRPLAVLSRDELLQALRDCHKGRLAGPAPLTGTISYAPAGGGQMRVKAAAHD